MPTLEEVSAYICWRPKFAEILDPDYFPLEWLDGEFASGRARLVYCGDAAGMFQIKTYPSGAKEVDGLLCAGDLSSIVGELIPAMESYGRSIGAISAVIESRAGWHRTLKDSGYSLHQTAMRKPFKA